ncbi:MAG: N-Acetyl-D-glucosamine ABC transport system, sugar-binding protein [uncultured Chloroflexia bacterium]|uniref:N-Acetyl-D-glucosamine ABC transport system, sugar-binding protein n=1 Tax=uncultured Chloroflexia bacterium TaxID=1672391 RepID=A0A6J4MNF0_9CHLR|nr:MAG: N-Acetyl-D-glucosamine ABC transport system, sugar-binding protein [uncultured Chloroflexia bacterium]
MRTRHLRNQLAQAVAWPLRIIGLYVGLSGSFALAQENAELLFTYWGSPQEKAAVESMVADFMEQHPDISVRAQHISNTTYVEKISAMLASGDPPDVAYLGEGQAFPWAAEGTLLDLSDYFKEDAEASSRLPTTYYNYGDGKTLGTNTAAETIVLYYNRALFEEAGVELPPTAAADAWTWDEFVEVAKKLTKDRSGNDATSADFDPENIETYGISFPQWWGGYLPLVYSNGGQFASEDGTELLLNQPEAVEVLQKMQDLIYVHHVSPTPAQSRAFPSADVMMQTGKVAMTMDGHWKVLDFSQLGMDWGMAVLPKFKEPVTILLGAPTVIFAATEYPDAAFEFYKFHNNPEYVNLFQKGLWMPLQETYYTDPEKTAAWLDGEEGVYPPEARDVLIDYTLNHTPLQPPTYWLKNFGQIESEALNPAFEGLWNGTLSAQEAMDQATEKAAPLLEGRW